MTEKRIPKMHMPKGIKNFKLPKAKLPKVDFPKGVTKKGRRGP